MSDKKESIVYYVVAAVSIFVLISYGTSRDIPPIVGFLIAGVSTYILYPNETIALSVALIVSAILRKTRREGYEDDDDDEDEEDIDEPMTNEPTNDLLNDSDEPMTVEPMKGRKKRKKNRNGKIRGKDKMDKKGEPFSLTPADFTPSNPSPNAPPPSTQDMDKLSGMIDKTMKLVEMLPEGFLNNAPK